MKHGYMGKVNSAKEFQEHVRTFERSGVSLDNVVVNVDFDEYITSLKTGDTIVVCSYVGLFPSLGAYLTKAIEMLEKGVVIESLQEPNIAVNDSNSKFINDLNTLNYRLRSTSSIKSIHKLMNEGKRLGRPRGSTLKQQKKVAQVEKLRRESNISVVAACKLAECNLKTYYRLRGEHRAPKQGTIN